MGFKKLFCSALALIAVLSIPAAHAGHSAGNGGDIIDCSEATNDNYNPIPKLLDFFEAEEIYRTEVDLGDPELSVNEKMELALSRLDPLDPGRAALYRDFAKNLLGQTKFISGYELVDVPDTDALMVPRGCKIRQAAVQGRPEYLPHYYYVINQDIWDLMDNGGKAGLILHEVIYREMISLGQTSSYIARAILRRLVNPATEKLAWEEWDAIRRDAGLWFSFGKQLQSGGFLGVWITDDQSLSRQMYYGGACPKMDFLSITGKAEEVKQLYPELGERLDYADFLTEESHFGGQYYMKKMRRVFGVTQEGAPPVSRPYNNLSAWLFRDYFFTNEFCQVNSCWGQEVFLCQKIFPQAKEDSSE